MLSPFEPHDDEEKSVPNTLSANGVGADAPAHPKDASVTESSPARYRAQGQRHKAHGCDSETGQLRQVIMCPPTHFEIVEPTNYMQWVYWSDGLPRPNPVTMSQQHSRLVEILREEGVEVELLPPLPHLPYQHATRDVGVVIGDTIVLSSMKERTRRLETEVAEAALQKYGLRILQSDRGFVEGGDVIVDGRRIWVGLGARTDMQGAELLDRVFGRDYEVIPLRFNVKCTHLDTVLGVLSHGHALVYEPAFEPASLELVRQAYPRLINLNGKEQVTGGANVLPLSPDKVVAIKENPGVCTALAEAGFEVIVLSYSEVIKSGGSVRCDTLPIARESVSSS